MRFRRQFRHQADEGLGCDDILRHSSASNHTNDTPAHCRYKRHGVTGQIYGHGKIAIVSYPCPFAFLRPTAAMHSPCFSCGDMSENLYDVLLQSDLNYRTSTGKKEYICNFDIPTATRAAGPGCTFCSFVDYVFMKPYYDPQSLGPVPWKRATTVENVSDAEFSAFASATEPTAACVICSCHNSRRDDGLCYLCRPRIAQYIPARSRMSSHASRLT